jgi:redox-sensing transcriptional repressor
LTEKMLCDFVPLWCEKKQGGLRRTAHRASKEIPEKTMARLSIYLRCAEELGTQGVPTISSQQTARRFGLNSAQLRKDLAYFGQFGIRGVGYHVHFLENSLKEILGLNQEWKVALVGAGNLGSALLKYKGFSQKGFEISAVFDADPLKVGRILGGSEIKDPEEMSAFLGQEGIRIGIIAPPLRPPKMPRKGCWFRGSPRSSILHPPS